MKKFLLIIGFTIILLVGGLTAVRVFAHEETDSEILKNCEWEDFEILYKDEEIEAKEFRVEFERARKKYHDYAKCLLNTSAQAMLATSLSEADLFTPSMPITTDIFANLNKPDTACIKQDDLNNILKESSPKNLLSKILEKYNLYSEHLNILYQKYRGNIKIDIETGDFHQILELEGKFGLMVENEIQNALVAMDQAFIVLKELRQAFVMHVHFQCMLRNLENYRRVLGNLRKIVTVIPGLIEDCSMHK